MRYALLLNFVFQILGIYSLIKGLTITVEAFCNKTITFSLFINA